MKGNWVSSVHDRSVIRVVYKYRNENSFKQVRLNILSYPLSVYSPHKRRSRSCSSIAMSSILVGMSVPCCSGSRNRSRDAACAVGIRSQIHTPFTFQRFTDSATNVLHDGPILVLH